MDNEPEVNEPEVKDPQLPWLSIVVIALVVIAGIYCGNHPDSFVANLFGSAHH